MPKHRTEQRLHADAPRHSQPSDQLPDRSRAQLSAQLSDQLSDQLPDQLPDQLLAHLLDDLVALRADIVAETAQAMHRVDEAHPDYRASACNLLNYLALRRRDLRPLQHRLAALGLSSLGRAEAHVLATIDAVLAALYHLAGRPQPDLPDACPVSFEKGDELLAAHTEALLGREPEGRGVRVMVTMPAEAADNYQLVQELLAQGMDCIRINCAHDGPDTWLRIIDNVKRAREAIGRPCLIAMDLGGPKLRTGPIDAGPAVLRVRPARDDYGRVTAPGRIWLTADTAPQPAPTGADATLHVRAAWLEQLAEGTQIRLTDAREARRTLTVVDAGPAGCWAETDKTLYITPETVLRLPRTAGKGKRQLTGVGGLPPREGFIRLRKGDPLVLTRALVPGRQAAFDSAGQLLTAASVGCTIPAIFDAVRAGETIWFDDGKIGGIILEAGPEALHIRITHARPAGTKLRADKGINLPDSTLPLPALTEKDIEDLAFVAEHADIVQLSFPNSAADVAALQEAQARCDGAPPAIVLKIETRRGFENLPDMLLAALRSPCSGVMIARGDLAVECGFERLAEVQEEILWVCEAAHVPVIWATQVLESLARNGMPSRAEVTDAAMADRAECVMLNKGPHIADAVRVLDDILRRMQAHQSKKRSMLRRLRLAHSVGPDGAPR